MSFKETDFTGIIGYLKGLIATQKDPILFRAMVTKLVEIYDQLPIYPGLVNMCVGQAQKTVEPKDLKKGQTVFIATDNGFVSGTITKTGKKITLKNVMSASESKTTEVDFGEIKQVSMINEDVVKELWPSLVFDKEQNK
jgi:hypothetical protein